MIGTKAEYVEDLGVSGGNGGREKNHVDFGVRSVLGSGGLSR